MLIVRFIQGFCMALADSVPGVSGGTVAFLLGFYEKFIQSLHDLVSKNGHRKEAVLFLGKIGIGWASGLILAVLFLDSIFASQIYRISSLFMGFILFALPIILYEERARLKGKYHFLIFTLLGIAAVSLLTYFNPVSGQGVVISVDRLSPWLAAYLFFAGMVAISAMVLPGISGSTFLLIFGLYVPVISAIKQVLQLNFNYLLPVALFGAGILTGIVLVVRLIRRCLHQYRPQMIYLIIGLMLGSLYSVVQGPQTLEIPQQPMTISTFNLLFFLLGGVVVIGMQMMKKVSSKSK